MILTFGYRERFRRIQKTHVRILVFDRPGNPAAAFTIDNHSVTAVVYQEASRSFPLHSNGNTTTSLYDSNDSSFSRSHSSISLLIAHKKTVSTAIVRAHSFIRIQDFTFKGISEIPQKEEVIPHGDSLAASSALSLVHITVLLV